MRSDASGPDTPLSREQQVRFAELVERFRALGAQDPEQCAESEVRENFAQLAGFCFLRGLSPQQIDCWLNTQWIDNLIGSAMRHPNEPFADAARALQRLLDIGARREDIARVARRIAYEAVFGVLERIDDGCDPDLDEDYPNWRLVEVDAGGRPTGRGIDGLHESIPEVDPSGREGRPDDISGGDGTDQNQ